jgi:hypothetical protein
MREHITEMLRGPGTLRFFVQPAIAILLGLLHGIRDRRGPPRPLLRAIAVPLCVAFIASVVFQYVIRTHVHFAYAVLYALLFVAIPYLLARELARRTAGFRARSKQ